MTDRHSLHFPYFPLPLFMVIVFALLFAPFSAPMVFIDFFAVSQVIETLIYFPDLTHYPDHAWMNPKQRYFLIGYDFASKV